MFLIGFILGTFTGIILIASTQASKEGGINGDTTDNKEGK